MPSLRGKILTAYGFSKAIMLVFAAVVFVDLHYLLTQIESGESVNTFREASHDMRREEKNLFLYQGTENLQQLLRTVGVAESAVNDNRGTFERIASESELARVGNLLEQYRTLISVYAGSGGPANAAQEKAIRNAGQELSSLADTFSHRERVVLAQAVQISGQTLLVAFIAVLVLGIAGALFLVRVVARPLRDLEIQLDRLADGKAQHLELPSQDNEIRSFVNHANSMLERLRWHQKQMRRQEKAAALGVLVSGVAHELNNPLSNISTSVQLLLEDVTPADSELRRQWLAQIDSESERSRRIVRRLLDSVRQPKLHVQTHDMAELINASLALIGRHLPRGMTVQIGAMPPLRLWVDRERIQQVFINLVKNAADAGADRVVINAQKTIWRLSMPEDSAHVVGEIEDISKADGVLLVQIDDNGPGIAPEHLAQIFNPFFTTHSAGDGTGLGLYLAAEIISEHHGCIAAENLAGGGTRFSIWLPLENQGEAA